VLFVTVLTLSMQMQTKQNWKQRESWGIAT